MSESRAVPAQRRRVLRVVSAFAAAFLAYTVFGFLAAPRIAHRLLVKNASAALGREVEIARVRVNPLALSTTIEGLAVRHRDGSAFLGWDSLYVRLAPLRIITGEIGLAEVRLVRPSVHVGIGADGALTFEDLLAGEPTDQAKPAANDDGMPLSVGVLAVEDARVAFSDATRSPAFRTTLGPLTIQLERFRTRGGDDSPYSFTGSTDAGETFRWTGTLSAQPLRSAGTLAFERVSLPRYGAYVRDQVPIEIEDGLLDLETTYELEWGPVTRILSLSKGKVVVSRLAMAPPGAADPPVKLPLIEVTGLAVDAIARSAQVGEVAIRGGALQVVREADGALELARMAPPESSSPSVWTWSVGAVVVSGVAIDVEDRVPARPAVLPLTDVQLRIEDLRSAPDSSWPVAASMVWNGRGRLAAKGPVQPFAAKGALEIEATDVDLDPLQPYVAPHLSAQLAGGTAGAKLRTTFDASTAAPRWTVTGDVHVDGLSVAEKGNDDLLRWQSLEINGIDAGSSPPHASARLVRLVQPRAKLYSWEDGTTSVARAFPASESAGASLASAAPAASAASAGRAAEPQWATSIGAVQVVRGRVTVVDRTVAPAAVVNVTGARAEVTNLSSDPKARSRVDARLEVEGASPITITGTLNPLQKDAYTNLAVTSRGVDLSPLDPYSGKFLGYGIQKGKLDLDLRYTIERRSLAATNVVRVNQFTLGDKTESPDATSVPVRLALALLQDREGVILLDVPVEGNLDDPEFRLGKVIWRTILNVLTKVATSPFSALAALAGGSDTDLSLVEFTPGSADPLPAAQERFEQLAKSLAQRPALTLELEGSSDAERDGPALRQVGLEQALRRAKAATAQVQGTSQDLLTLVPDERARLVRSAYEARFPATPAKPGESAQPQPSLEEMEGRLAAAVEVPPDEYRALAAERARRAREELVAAGLDQARLFLSQGGRAEKEGGARVYFTVK